MEVLNFNQLIEQDLVFVEFEAENKDDLIIKLANILEEKGYVNKDYARDVIEREKKYPTALPTDILSVAIPHAESDKNVITPSIVIVKLSEPIQFIEMGSLDNKIDVNMVFLLAVKGNKTQLSLLPKLISIFSEKEKMKILRSLTSEKEIFDMIRKELDD